MTRSQPADVDAAIEAARHAFPAWAAQTVARRGDILRQATIALQQRTDEFARIVHLETGKSMKDARGEVGAAVEMGFFVAGEGRRFYGKTTTSAVPNKLASVQQARAGVAVVNGPTHGSEPHMPFGGLRHSGNGLREAGTEALDVYSDWKTVYVNFDPAAA